VPNTLEEIHEVETQETAKDSVENITDEIIYGKSGVDSNSCALELELKTEDSNEKSSLECGDVDSTSSQNICETGPQTDKVTEIEIGSDQLQEANFLSIVDRIKTDITTLKTLSKTQTNASLNVNNEATDMITGTDHSNSKSSDNDNISQTQQSQKESEASARKSENQVMISKELSSHLINLSSANISEQLRKSCSNIVAMNQDFSKEFLLRKLEELLKQESKQVSEDLESRRQQLRETQTAHSEELGRMTQRHKNEVKTLQKQQAIKLAKIENLYLDEIEET